MDRDAAQRWIDAYERAWRTPGTDGLPQLFTVDATYLVSPWAEPIVGLDAIGAFWERGRDGPDEPFTMTSEIVAVDGPVAVVRLAVDYGDPEAHWLDLWILRFDDDGRCTAFEEWPFAPDQRDGHDPAELSPGP